MFKPIISLAVIIFSLGFGVFYVKPAYDRVQEKRANIVTLDKTFKTTDTIQDLIDQTAESLRVVDPDALTRFNVFLPETIDEIRLANNLQSLGEKNGLVLNDIKVTEKEKSQKKEAPKSGGATGALSRTLSVGQAGPVGQQGAGATTGETAESKFKATKAGFTVVATYDGFRLFLDDLEKSLGVINITSLAFREFGGGEDSALPKGASSLYDFTVEIETYSLN